MNIKLWENEDLIPHVSRKKGKNNTKTFCRCELCGKEIVLAPGKVPAKNYVYLPSGGALKLTGYIHQSCLDSYDSGEA